MKLPISILIVDNFDSFTYNLFHYLQPLAQKVEVVRYDKVVLDEVKIFQGIVLSPGPGLPSVFPVLKNIISELGKTIPILGVCLGHQAIAEAFGAKLRNMPEVWHGVARDTHVVKEDVIFNEIPEIFSSGRYHSWAVSDNDFPSSLKVTARDSDGTIMALKHASLPITGIQFHPESILSPYGAKILENWTKELI